MSESEHRCTRCGTYLPTVTVRVPVFVDVLAHDGTGRDLGATRVIERYGEREEIADCIRCTGSY